MPLLDESTSPHSRSIRFKRLRLGAIVLGVLVILAFAGASAYDTWRAYRNALVATDRELGNVAKALAEQTAWTWEGIDLLLRDTARWYQNDGRQIAPERLNEVLTNRTAGVRQVRLLTIVDAQGIQRHRSRGSSPPHLDVSDRSYFIAQRDHGATGLFMSEPLVTRSENRPGFVLSRRLEDDQGRFAGVITAIIDLEDLKEFYGDVDLGGGSAIHLLREDGTLLVRNPPKPQAVGAARDEAERGVALEHRILGRRHPVHLEVVVHERHGADAHGLGALGEVGDARPDAGRTAGPVESHDVEIKLHTSVLPDEHPHPLQAGRVGGSVRPLHRLGGRR